MGPFMSVAGGLHAALPVAGNLDRPAHYIDWGPVQISVGNLVMIGVIVVLFVLAILLPFPKGRRRP
jgi:hypothetical protein